MTPASLPSASFASLLYHATEGRHGAGSPRPNRATKVGHKSPLPQHGLAPLQSILPDLGITKRTLKKLEAISLIREQRESGRQELAYNARPFVLCGIPLRRPPNEQLTYTRRNGKFFLQIAGHPQFGLPFGQDRLIPIWVATLALRQKSREVHFNTAARMLDFFRLPKDGPHYRRIVEGFKRIFAATIFFGTEEQPDGASVVDWARFHFFDRMKLWFNANEQKKSLTSSHHDNVITLSDPFYREIDQHRIPVEREVIAAMAHAPGALDFYIWLVWKSWTVNSTPTPIPLFADYGLKDQLGTNDYTADKRFRQTIVAWIGKIRALWPQCPGRVSNDGRFLVIRSSKASPAIRSTPPDV